MADPEPVPVTLAEIGAAVGPDAALDADAAGTVVRGIEHDSRRMMAGALFACVRGAHTDGHDHAGEAVARGAVALLIDRDVDANVPVVRVPDVRAALGRAAACCWGNPSARLDVVGVTGTNGKTTVTHLLAAVLRAAGRRTAVLGTLSGVRTTPEAPELQRILAGCVAAGDAAVAMEVSSHALELGRVDGTRFAAAVFTNLSQDHLDFHGSMEAYFAAKARLFDPSRTSTAIVDVDDPYGLRIADLARSRGLTVAEVRGADATVVASDAGSTTFRWRGRTVRLPLAGAHNVANALAAATTALELGLDLDDVAAGLAAAAVPAGRFEPVEAGQPFAVVVDYAHTPDALDRVLAAARDLVGSEGRVLVVFGCGGDRDPGKRAPMGAVASQRADVVVITSDNPRGESPAAIAGQVRSGVVSGCTTVVELDRRRAIAATFALARPGDLVVIAGKGHETTQQIGDTVVDFDDRVVAREELAAAGWQGGGGGPR